ncbi:MAG: transcription termination/antitermination protein NusG [Planctomycetota bacterium]
MIDESQAPLQDETDVAEAASSEPIADEIGDESVSEEVQAEAPAESDDESTGEVFLDSDEPAEESADIEMDWYILKVAFNREDSIADALRKKIALEGMDEYFGDVVVPSEDVATFTRDGKKRISKRKLLPGYIMARMAINDDTWFLVRETAGISDFTGSAGKPMPMDPADVDRFIKRPEADDEEEAPIKVGIPFKVGDRVRVKEGNFENQEGDVDALDEANGRITVIINIFGRSVPMELDHWQVEPL